MSTNSDLAHWGEPPATPGEQTLGTMLDNVLTRIERGQMVKPESLWGEGNELVEGGPQLVPTISLLYECAATVWEHSTLTPGDDPGGPPHPSKLGVSTVAPLHPEEREDKIQVPPVPKAVSLPDPFPGEFRLLSVLGEGACGKVWLADDLKLARQVALKTLKLPATSTLGPQVLAALRQEAQVVARLQHPNIVKVYAWREARGEYYLVLQFVAGGSLADRLKKEKTLDWQQAARFLADVGEALLEAHKCGVVHRDIKPANILWNAEKDEALLTDFGVSAHLAEPGTVAGTPNFMAPEAFQGRATAASDVFSLAVSLYQLLTGELPFRGTTREEHIQSIEQGLPDPDPLCEVMPEPVERIIRSGLAALPERRPALPEFVTMLRSSLNQLLTDSLVSSDPASEALQVPDRPVDLRLIVSRQEPDGTYKQVASTHPKPGALSRDMKKVPRPPKQVCLSTGDRVRIEVVADREGYVTVFNVGPTGNLNLLYPEELPGNGGSPPRVVPHQPRTLVDVELTPPAGGERLFAVWSRVALPMRLDQLPSLVDKVGVAPTRPYQATRDLKRLQHSVQHLSAEDWRVVVLALDHR
jgi:serine/threonine protein kinase